MVYSHLGSRHGPVTLNKLGTSSACLVSIRLFQVIECARQLELTTKAYHGLGALHTRNFHSYAAECDSRIKPISIKEGHDPRGRIQFDMAHTLKETNSPI
jgi:hypothetical protein